MRNCESSAGRARVWKSVAWSGMAIFFLSTSTTRAQDVAEAARQEQSRKVAQKNSPKHVYSEEDLKKKTILTPDDQAKVAARKQPDQQDPEKERERAQQPAQHQNAAVESLGDIARQYRIEKSAREAQATAKKAIVVRAANGHDGSAEGERRSGHRNYTAGQATKFSRGHPE
jgi:hypothetical protein